MADPLLRSIQTFPWNPIVDASQAVAFPSNPLRPEIALVARPTQGLAIKF
jgi:hypothetical protein